MKDQVLLTQEFLDALGSALDMMAQAGHDKFSEAIVQTDGNLHSSSVEQAVKQYAVSQLWVSGYKLLNYDQIKQACDKQQISFEQMDVKNSHHVEIVATSSIQRAINGKEDKLLKNFDFAESCSLLESTVYHLIVKAIHGKEPIDFFSNQLFIDAFRVGLGNINIFNNNSPLSENFLRLDFDRIKHQLNKDYKYNPNYQRILTAIAEVGVFFNEFKQFTPNVKNYSTNKDAEVRAAANCLKEIDSVMGLNIFYVLVKPYINKHRETEGFEFTNLFQKTSVKFGNVQTTTWQGIAGEIRDRAYEQLEEESKKFTNPKERKVFLMAAKLLPVFKGHISNWYQGGFGINNTQNKIQKLINACDHEAKFDQYSPKRMIRS